MRIRHPAVARAFLPRTLLHGAITVGLALGAAGCFGPINTLLPSPQGAGGTPDVEFFSLYAQPWLGESGTYAYAVTQTAYTALFEVDQRGRVRVLSPESPGMPAMAVGGRGYVVQPSVRISDREFVPAVRDFNRVPYLFVLTSDTPFDLSAFGTGSRWGAPLVTTTYDPDSAIAEIARRVIPNAPSYGSDYAYVRPRLRTAEQQFASQCARPLEDVHNYRYFRDLWAVFDPNDQRLSLNPNWMFSPVLGWSSYAILPLASYRAQLAPAAFYQACSPAPSLSWGQSYAGLYSGYGYGYGYGSVYGLFGGYPYGYANGYGYWYGRPAGTPSGRVAFTPPRISGEPVLRIPRTPITLGTQQVVGSAPSSPASNANAGRASAIERATTSGRLGWQQVGGVSDPSAVTRLGERVDGGSFSAAAVAAERFSRPEWGNRRPYESQPTGGAMPQVYGGRVMDNQPASSRPTQSRPMVDPGSDAGRSTPVRSEPAFSPRATSPSPMVTSEPMPSGAGSPGSPGGSSGARPSAGPPSAPATGAAPAGGGAVVPK